MPMYAGSSWMVGMNVPRSDVADVRVGQQRRRHVGQQRQAEPLEDAFDEPVRAEDLERQDAEADGHDEDQDGHRQEEVDGGGDGADVGPGIDRVGHQDGADRRVQHPAGVVLTQDAGQATPVDQADLAADVLDGRHHRQHQERRPQRPIAVAGAGLRVGPDAGRVVVRGAGHEPGPQDLQDPLEGVGGAVDLADVGIDRSLWVDLGAARGPTPPGARSRSIGRSSGGGHRRRLLAIVRRDVLQASRCPCRPHRSRTAGRSGRHPHSRVGADRSAVRRF